MQHDELSEINAFDLQQLNLVHADPAAQQQHFTQLTLNHAIGQVALVEQELQVEVVYQLEQQPVHVLIQPSPVLEQAVINQVQQHIQPQILLGLQAPAAPPAPAPAPAAIPAAPPAPAPAPAAPPAPAPAPAAIPAAPPAPAPAPAANPAAPPTSAAQLGQQQAPVLDQPQQQLQVVNQQAAVNQNLLTQGQPLAQLGHYNVDLINFDNFAPVQQQIIQIPAQNLPVAPLVQIAPPLPVVNLGLGPAQQQNNQLVQQPTNQPPTLVNAQQVNQQLQLLVIQDQLLAQFVDFDDMAHSNILTPDFLKGSRDDDCEEWLRQVEHWMSFKNMIDPQKSAAVPVLLRDSALYFYDTLTNTQKTDFDEFKIAFLRRYRTDGLNGWQEAAAVWIQSNYLDSLLILTST